MRQRSFVVVVIALLCLTVGAGVAAARPAEPSPFRKAIPGRKVDVRAKNSHLKLAPILSEVTRATSPGQASLAPATANIQVTYTGFTAAAQAAFEAAVQNLGLMSRPNTKVNRSWDPRDPDDALSTARLKSMVGEPWYQVVADDAIQMHPAWTAAYLPSGRILLSSAIPIRARCHNAVSGALGAALDEVAAAGLGGAIDVTNANTYGGCFNARYNRISGFLSRHAYAVALDMNTTSNCQGCTPHMNCDVVRIFRKHGFAWGGNFRTPDGMHFEWVGEARDQIAYPSRYCPNNAGGAPQSNGPSNSVTAEMGLDVLISGLDNGTGA